MWLPRMSKMEPQSSCQYNESPSLEEFESPSAHELKGPYAMGLTARPLMGHHVLELSHLVPPY